MQVLPSNGIPVTLWPSKDEVWSGVAAGIRNAIQEFQKSRK